MGAVNSGPEFQGDQPQISCKMDAPCAQEGAVRKLAQFVTHIEPLGSAGQLSPRVTQGDQPRYVLIWTPHAHIKQHNRGRTLSSPIVLWYHLVLPSHLSPSGISVYTIEFEEPAHNAPINPSRLQPKNTISKHLDSIGRVEGETDSDSTGNTAISNKRHHHCASHVSHGCFQAVVVLPQEGLAQLRARLLGCCPRGLHHRSDESLSRQ
jgi:hypothetical protein